MKIIGYVIPAVLLLTSCSYSVSNSKYDEIPSMLNVLTNKAQSAIEQGYLESGEQVVREYIGRKNPDVLEWFQKNSYELRVGKISEYAVVLVCDDGRPIFEDTYCNPGFPDKDHRNTAGLHSCDITMTFEEVKNICEEP